MATASTFPDSLLKAFPLSNMCCSLVLKFWRNLWRSINCQWGNFVHFTLLHSSKFCVLIYGTICSI